VLDELKSIPEDKRRKYWLDNMPLLLPQDAETFPADFMRKMIYEYNLIFHKTEGPSFLVKILAILAACSIIFLFAHLIGG